MLEHPPPADALRCTAGPLARIASRFALALAAAAALLFAGAAGAPAQTPGSFAPTGQSPFETGTNPEAAIPAFIDGDLDVDLATASSDGVTVHLGDGQGGFEEAAGGPYATSADNDEIVAADFNNDNRTDLAVKERYASDVFVLLGAGDGTFSEAPTSPLEVSTPLSLAAHDMDGDGNADLVAGSADKTGITVLLGDGAGGFDATAASPWFDEGEVEWPGSLVPADLNGDGDVDLAAANEIVDGVVTILLGDGNGGFLGSPASFDVGSYPSGIDAGGLNGGPHTDLVVTNSRSDDVTVLLGDGSGAFNEAPGSPIGVGTNPQSVVISHLDGGAPDLAVVTRGHVGPAGDDGEVAILLGDGSGGFDEAEGSPIEVGSDLESVVAAGFDDDGATDLAVADEYNPGRVHVLLNETPSCRGSLATIAAEPGEVTLGTPGPDVIVGTAEDDTIRARGGADLVCSGGGADIVRGGGGLDRLFGGGGFDRLAGGAGHDLLFGARGRDVLRGGGGRDDLRGGQGHDRLGGGPGADLLRGGPGSDLCRGNQGRDRLAGCER